MESTFFSDEAVEPAAETLLNHFSCIQVEEEKYLNLAKVIQLLLQNLV